MVHGTKAPSTKNVNELLDLNGHINTNTMFKPTGLTHENKSSLEPVLFEKLHNIKLSCSVFWIATFFQFVSPKTALQILLQYAQDFENNLTTLYAQFISDNAHKSCATRQCVLTYSALCYLCTDEC